MPQINMTILASTLSCYNSDSTLILHSSNMHTVSKPTQQPYSDRGANVWEKYTQAFKDLSQNYSRGNSIPSKQQNETKQAKN